MYHVKIPHTSSMKMIVGATLAARVKSALTFFSSLPNHYMQKQLYMQKMNYCGFEFLKTLLVSERKNKRSENKE